MRKALLKTGFSLLEMSVVVVIVGLLAGSAVSIMASTMQRSQYTETKDKITEIKKSLYRFYANNSRLPCPAQSSLVVGDANYGAEIFSHLCDVAVTAGSTPMPAGTARIGSAGSYVDQGAVPTRALGLPDSMMLDAYGNKFTYMVTEKFTTSSVDGVITVNDGVIPTTVSSVAGVAIISHGKDGKGAWTQSGAQITCGSSVRDAENCDGDAVVTDAQFNDLATGATAWFDDVVGWAIKSEITSLATTSSSCGYQFFVDSGTFTLPTGVSSYRVLAIGGGGGGGGGAVYTAGVSVGGAGGGGSGYVDVASGVTFSGSSTITIGSGGPGGATGAAGSAGTATTLTNETPDITGSTGGAGGAAGTTGTGGSGGVAGNGGVDNAVVTPVKASNGTSQASFAITSGGAVINDGTDSVTFRCAKFSVASGYSNSAAFSGGSGGNGISSILAPVYGIIPAGAGGSASNILGFSGTNGGGGGGSARKGSGSGTPSGGGAGAGGAGGAGNAVDYSVGGGGGGYGGGGAGGTSGSSTTYCAGGGGGYGGGTGGGYGGATTLGGGGGGAGNGCTLGGIGGRGYGGGGGGGSGGASAFSGGGGGANGLVYIEWDN